jgi:hypothetical protein
MLELQILSDGILKQANCMEEEYREHCSNTRVEGFNTKKSKREKIRQRYGK